MFARLEAWFNTFFLGYAARVSADLAAGLVPAALALVTVYIAVYGLAVMRGEASEPFGTFAWKMAKVMAILSFALPGLYYSGNVVAGALGLQDGLANLFIPPRGAAALTAFTALDAANTASDDQVQLLWKDASVLRIDLAFAGMMFNAGTTVLLVVGAFVALLGRLVLTFGLAIGPLAILCLLFKPTARFFDSWLSFILSAVVLSWFVFFALGMSLFVADRVVASLRDSGAFIPGGLVSAIQGASTYLAVMILLGIVLYQAPSLASSLTGGASIQSGAQMVSNTMLAMRLGRGGGSSGGTGAAGGGSMSSGGGAGAAAGRLTASAGGTVARSTRAAYQQVAQRGRAST